MVRPPVEYSGRAAAPGLADGPLVSLNPPAVEPGQGSGDPAMEEQRLIDAIAASIEQIMALTGSSEDETASILEFQIAMLEDDALSGPAFSTIASGGGAPTAWHAALAEQISDYQAADDEYFRARAADLADLRDRVLRNLSGEGQSATPPGAILAGDDITPTR
ncbi:MAG TPA: phosphoenolpyruvate-utilizing N-terminal domain-containing protein, partial [Afifellaceae bacterium]|nr:phosphoenolpyruvate-utilizing N-terminal domain-containing protein [Afifellaceae bacterium]